MFGSYGYEIARHNRTKYDTTVVQRDLVAGAWSTLRGVNDGGSWSLHDGKPTAFVRGFMVGGVTGELVILAGEWEQNRQNVLDRLVRFVTDARTIKASDHGDYGLYLGTWRDPETGSVHVDVSQLVPHHMRDTAIRLGTERGEISIWDLEADDAIYMTA